MLTSNKMRIVLLSILMLLLVSSCDFPTRTTEEPYEFPTPNLTMTALFAPLLTPSGTIESAAATATELPTWTPTDTEEVSQPTEIPTETPVPIASSTPIFTPTVSYSGPGMRTGSSIAANYIEDELTIDGYLGDWENAIYPASIIVYGEDNVSSNKDLSSTVMVGWDEDYLYIGARVKDDAYVQYASEEEIYLGDYIEILLDTNVADDYYLNSLSSDDFQLGISPGNQTADLKPSAYLWFPSSLSRVVPEVNIGVLFTENGYHIEAAVPWSVMNVTPYKGQHFGFVFAASDNDVDKEKIQESMVSNVGTRILTSPMTWGDLTLTE